ncbi:uncharacterized protein TNCT_137971 [Trichonephila clavata]|uniref:Uncharacterized protein n=1 Tax=Trichonephila clavata TaxID=2740835 RepID=A0A8X6LJ58_TRICU|nr:uncharacterized protein TNCT_137971 [Trichonephila clavata]
MCDINVRKRTFDFPDFADNDEEDFLINPNKKNKKTISKQKFDLDFAKDAIENKIKIPPYLINVGKGLLMEVKEFRSNFYVGLCKVSEANEVRNRFNIPIEQLETFRKALDAMITYVKEKGLIATFTRPLLSFLKILPRTAFTSRIF